MRDELGTRSISKAKIEIALGKTGKFDNLMTIKTEQYVVNEEQKFGSYV